MLRVGHGKTLSAPSAAAKVARDGEVIEIEAGVYNNDVAVWNQNDLTIRSIGARAHLHTNGRLAEDKGIWVIKGRNVTIEDAEFSGARGPYRNGSGIRGEGIGLTLRGCYFHHNDTGVLAGGGPRSEIVVERSEFAENGRVDGRSHNIYIASVKTFTLRASYSHHAMVGHGVKSRAATNYILYNCIMDEVTGSSSYGIDLCEGGGAYLIGNVLQKGPRAQNRTIVAYGAEGLRHADNRLYIVNNTMVNDRPEGGALTRLLRGGRFVCVWGAPSRVRLINNLFVGPGRMLWGRGEQSHNLQSHEPGLVSREQFDYRLRDTSPALGAGTNPGCVNGLSLAPVAQYLHRAREESRPIRRGIDIGAYGRSSPPNPLPDGLAQAL
jgi:parallel beta helix pectate lyase-like protein